MRGDLMQFLYIDESGTNTIEHSDKFPYFIISLVHVFDKDKLKKVIKKYISKNYAEQITAHNVADACHVSVSYLQHLFAELLGHGIAEEIRLQRLEAAKEMLATTAYSVRYIALCCGFCSPDYFSTVFKRQLGITPLKYRKSKEK